MIEISDDVFQGTVTHYKKNRKKLFKIFSIFLAFIIIFSVIFLTIFVKNNIKNNSIFETKKFYIVYAKKSKEMGELSSLESKIKSIGGGGEIFLIDKIYYLSVCVYSQKSDATEISKKISKNYPKCGILTIETKDFSSVFKKIIKSNQSLKKFLSKNEKTLSDFIDSELLFLSGKCSSHDYLKFLISSKLLFSEMMSKLEVIKSETPENYSDDKILIGEMASDKINKFFSELALYLQMQIASLDSCITDFYGNNKNKESISCLISCQIVVNYYDFCNNLSKQ